MLDNAKTWEVGVITFLFCTIVGAPIGYLYARHIVRREKRPNPEKMRKAYEMQYLKWK